MITPRYMRRFEEWTAQEIRELIDELELKVQKESNSMKRSNYRGLVEKYKARLTELEDA